MRRVALPFQFLQQVCRNPEEFVDRGRPRWAVIWRLTKKPCDARWDLRCLNVSVNVSQLLSELVA